MFARWHLLHWDILLLKKDTLISVCIILFARETLDSSLYDVILFACHTPWLTLDSSLYDLILFTYQTPWFTLDSSLYDLILFTCQTPWFTLDSSLLWWNSIRMPDTLAYIGFISVWFNSIRMPDTLALKWNMCLSCACHVPVRQGDALGPHNLQPA